MVEPSDKDWSPIMPFWVDTEGYTDRDREMFVCGIELQMIYDKIKEKPVHPCRKRKSRSFDVRQARSASQNDPQLRHMDTLRDPSINYDLITCLAV